MVMIRRLRHFRELVFVIALAGVVVGLISMHHLSVFNGAPATDVAPASMPSMAATVDHEPAAGAPSPEEHSGHGTDLLHLCLAVLMAGAAVVLGLLAWRRGTVVPGAGNPIARLQIIGSRAPPLRVPRRLALLCVLRT